MYVLAFSLGGEILKRGSREYRRMQSYAAKLDEYHVVVLTTAKEKAHFVDGNFHVHALSARTKIGLLLQGFAAARSILKRKNKGWVVTSQDPLFVGLFGLTVAHMNTVPHVVQVHGDVFGPYGYSRILQRLGMYVVERSVRVRVVSERIKKSFLARGVSEAKISVLPIRAELESFLNVHGNQSQDPLRIVTVSRLAPEKNIEMLIRSFANLGTEGVRSVLEIVGSGPEEQKLKALVHTLGITDRVTFTPWTSDIPTVMSRANICALASKHEGYALVLLEALAAGVPVVTTDVGCVGETVKNGEHGLVVSVGDEVAFTDALRTLIQNSAQRAGYGENGRILAQTLAGTSTEAYAEAWVATLSV